MNDLAATISAAQVVMDVPFELYGFTFSFWDILIWSSVAGIVILIIWGFFR